MKHIRTLEEWKDIKGYEGIYQVSDLGRIRSLDRLGTDGRSLKGKILKSSKRHDGYLQVHLSKNGKVEICFLHRLVAEAFCPNPENLPFVNHCNERKDDNKAFNLDWVTAKENTNYGTCFQRISISKGTAVRCLETNQCFCSAREAERQTGISYQGISKCCQGKQKKAGKLHWEYID